MKTATKHADQLKSLTKRLAKENKAAPREELDPLHALVKAAMSFDVPDNKADDAMKAIEREFVDLNELRVATELEVQEMLGQRYPQIEKRVQMITLALNAIFEKEHTLSLDRLKTIPKKEARQFLKSLPESTAFTEAFVMLHAFDGHAMPVDEQTLALLIDEGVIDEGGTAEDVQKFIEQSLKADEVFDLYRGLRRAGQDLAKAKKSK